MKEELAHSFNIHLDTEVIGRLKSEQEKLTKQFKERRFYDSSPHLAIATKFMDKETAQDFVRVLVDEFKDDVQWTLEFSDFSLSDTKDYIFLHLSKKSRRLLFKLHERVFRVTKDIGLEEQSNNKFRHFEYDPHISILKVEPTEAEKALSLIEKDFSGVKTQALQYEITQQTDNKEGFSTFPVIYEINLK